MIQAPRRYPFKKLQMVVTRVGDNKYEYVIYENGKKLCSRIEVSGYIACLVYKNRGKHLYKICHFYSRLMLVKRSYYDTDFPYALGLIEKVDADEKELKKYSGIARCFLPKKRV